MENQTREILLASLHRDASRFDAVHWPALGEEEWAALIAMAARHGVAPLLYQRLKTPTMAGRIPDRVLERLRGFYLNTAASNVRLYEELRVLLLALRAAGIPVLVLKGAYLAVNVYRNIALRPMSDIDILVPKTAARAALKALQGAGYELLAPATEEAIPWAGKDMVLRKEGHHFPVEVHWTLTDQEIDVNMDEGWERSQTARIDGIEVGVLSLEDFLLHICLHASYHHSFNISLTPLYDIALFIDQFQRELAWDRFYQYTASYRWDKGVYLILWLARERVGANAPAEILEKLKPVDLPEAMVTAAEYRIFQGRDAAGALSNQFVSLWGRAKWIEKLRAVWRSIFLSREVMARLYPVRLDSLWLYGYYLIRMKDLAVRYGQPLWRLLRGEREFAETVRQRDALHEWLFK